MNLTPPTYWTDKAAVSDIPAIRSGAADTPETGRAPESIEAPLSATYPAIHDHTPPQRFASSNSVDRMEWLEFGSQRRNSF